MALDLKQSLKLSQQLLMTPQLQQAIKLLQLSRTDLEQYINQQLMENPVLEETYSETIVAAELGSTEIKETPEVLSEQTSDSQRLDDSWEPSDWLQRTYSNNEAEVQSFEQYTSKKQGLQEAILGQTGELDLSPKEQRVIVLLVGNLDDRGYLQADLQEIAEEVGVTVDEVEDGLDVIQRCDPAGVGARDLRECLLLQIKFRGLKNGIMERLVEHHLADLERQDFPKLARVLKISRNEVIAHARRIAELEPVPGRRFSSATPQYVIPDVYIVSVGGQWVVTMNDEGLPTLQIAEIYEEMLSSATTRGKDRGYIQEKIKSAQWLMRSIDQRQRTIYKVAVKILERQQDFFNLGVKFLKPMVLKDIADDIEMHESTISRVSNNKYVHTPHGIFELKYFFSSPIAQAMGDDISSSSVKRMLSDMIREEDPKEPLADQRIVSLFQDKGIRLARRTVAKYREQLGILPSRRRKRLY